MQRRNPPPHRGLVVLSSTANQAGVAKAAPCPPSPVMGSWRCDLTMHACSCRSTRSCRMRRTTSLCYTIRCSQLSGKPGLAGTGKRWVVLSCMSLWSPRCKPAEQHALKSATLALFRMQALIRDELAHVSTCLCRSNSPSSAPCAVRHGPCRDPCAVSHAPHPVPTLHAWC